MGGKDICSLRKRGLQKEKKIRTALFTRKEREGNFFRGIRFNGASLEKEDGGLRERKKTTHSYLRRERMLPVLHKEKGGLTRGGRGGATRMMSALCKKEKALPHKERGGPRPQQRTQNP